MAMKKIVPFLFVVVIFTACKGKKNIPDVSGVNISMKVERFDQDFFSIDTNQLDNSMNELSRKYPFFLNTFLQNIVGITDRSAINTYYRLYKPIYDSSHRIYANFDPVKKQVEEAFRYVKHYFPSYKTPSMILPVLGPMNSREDFARMASGDYTPDFIGPDFLGISLQFYLGQDFSLYHDQYFVNNVAPLYRSRRFSKEYIISDIIRLVVDDLFPDKSNSRPLVEQMIEKGKQWWLLDKFLPEVPDSIKTGYKQQQLEWASANEGLIWSYILKNEDLYSNNPATVQNYIGEAPFTQNFDQDLSPGNLGQWIGWQIVKAFAEKNSSLKPEEVMQATPKRILDEAKYKPK